MTIPETTPETKPAGSAKLIFSWLCVGLLLISLVVPVAQMPIIGTVNMFSAQDGTPYWFLGFAALAAAATFFKSYRLLAVPGILVLATTLYYIYHFYKVKADLAASLRGNPFAGLATGLAATVHLQWGVAVLLAAGVALVVVSTLKHDADTILKLLAANKSLLIKSVAALGALFLAVAVLPGVLSATSGNAGQSTPPQESTSANPIAAGSQANQESPPTPDSRTAALSQIVTVGVLEKGFHEADSSNGDFESAFTVKLQYRNLGTKTITGFKGSLRFYDQFNAPVQSFRVEYQKDLRPGAIVVEDDRYDFNQFEANDAKLRETPLAKLHVVWEPSRINYTDGSTTSAATE